MKNVLRLTVIAILVMVSAAGAYAQNTGSIFTTDSSCTGVNVNIFTAKTDVYLDGGPQNNHTKNGLPDGNYWVRITNPSTATLLGMTSTASVVVLNGSFAQCYQLMAIAPFANTPNAGGEYKVEASLNPLFPPDETKSDNFKVPCTKPATPSPTNGGPYCIGSQPITVQLNANTTADGYSWSATGPDSYTFSSSDQNPTATVSEAGSYTFTLTVSSGACTSDAGSTTVVVNADPATPSPSNDGPYCLYSNPTTIQLHSNAPGMTYSWTGPNGFTSSASDPTDSITASGSYDYYLSVTDAHGCTSEVAGKTTVVVYDPPTVTVSASGPTTFCLGGSVTLTATPAGTGPFTYLWSDGETTQSITVTAAGSYSVTVKDQGTGCSVTSSATVVTTLFCACNLTQGAYGSTGGAGTVSGVNTLIGSGLLIGGGSKTFSFISGDGACLVLRMPAGGTPVVLPTAASKFTYPGCGVTVSSFLKNGKFNDVLFGQTVTLALNVRGNIASLPNVPLCANMTTQHVIGVYLDPNSVPTTFTIPASVLTALGPHPTVAGLLNLANAALGGTTGLPSLSDINTAVNNINVGFDGCRALVGCN